MFKVASRHSMFILNIYLQVNIWCSHWIYIYIYASQKSYECVFFVVGITCLMKGVHHNQSHQSHPHKNIALGWKAQSLTHHDFTQAQIEMVTLIFVFRELGWRDTFDCCTLQNLPLNLHINDNEDDDIYHYHLYIYH